VTINIVYQDGTAFADAAIIHNLFEEKYQMLKLLVAEDDAANLELLVELLRSLKTEVHASNDSEEVAKLVEREAFDGIFLDLGMPGLSGFDLAKLIRDSVLNRTTPIVIVTGRDERDTMHLSFSVGATYFLQKPVDQPNLVAILGKLQEPRYENRRRSNRVSLNSEVTCIVGDRTLHGVTWNISQGGIQLEVFGLQKGDQLKMSFLLPNPATIIQCEGVIVWEQEERQGVYFTSMRLEAQDGIRDFVNRAGT
jgi:CheY-like chemotaxis protein